MYYWEVVGVAFNSMVQQEILQMEELVAQGTLKPSLINQIQTAHMEQNIVDFIINSGTKDWKVEEEEVTEDVALCFMEGVI